MESDFGKYATAQANYLDSKKRVVGYGHSLRVFGEALMQNQMRVRFPNTDFVVPGETITDRTTVSIAWRTEEEMRAMLNEFYSARAALRGAWQELPPEYRNAAKPPEF